MADQLEFLNGVAKLHAFYTEHVRMLAHAYGLSDEQAAKLLDGFGYYQATWLRDPAPPEGRHHPGRGRGCRGWPTPLTDAGPPGFRTPTWVRGVLFDLDDTLSDYAST